MARAVCDSSAKQQTGNDFRPGPRSGDLVMLEAGTSCPRI